LPLLFEIEALTVKSYSGFPKRNCVGFSLERLLMLSAIISSRLGFNLSGHDIYLNVVGGLKIQDPAADLAVCLSIISAHKNFYC